METAPLADSSSDWPASPRRRWDAGPLMLLAVAAGTVLLWRVPWGPELLWPFTILATWYHEMGHALMAFLLGGDAVELFIFADGSGLARYEGPVALGRIGRALVAAGGPVAPSLAGGLMIVCSRKKAATGWCLFGLSMLLMLSAVVWIDWWESLLGAIVVFALGAALLMLVLLGPSFVKSLALQVCGVQACIALWRDWSYFLSSRAAVGGEVRHSDAAVIAEALWLPHWFWGLGLSVFSLAILLVSLWLAFRPQRRGTLNLGLRE